MTMTPEQMKMLSFKNSKFLSLADGETSRAFKTRSVQEVPDQRDPSKTKYLYTLEFELPDGSLTTKFFNSSSNRLLATMADLMGKKIALQRHGVGTETKYEVILVND